MSVASAVAGALLCAALFGCGERAGDPVVALAGEQSLPGGGELPGAGPVGLCGACSTSRDCGDANDACVHLDGASFCGRDCDDQHRCPDGYSCVELNDDRLRQCVPHGACPEPRPAPSLTDVRQQVLSLINAERALLGLSALEPSACLDELAQSSALEFAATDEPLANYVKDCDPIWPSCECGWSAEAEITLSGYDLDWNEAIGHAIETNAAGASTDARFTRTLSSDDVSQVGIGFYISGDELWIALSFA